MVVSKFRSQADLLQVDLRVAPVFEYLHLISLTLPYSLSSADSTNLIVSSRYVHLLTDESGNRP
jgi:hypothetical protein